MRKLDPEIERKRLAEHYASLPELSLRELANQAGSLTDLAKEALKAELSKRGLTIEVSDAPDAARDSPNNFVTVRQFRDVPNALLAQSVLESAGIDCFLFDENIVRTDWLWSNLVGGIKLLVKEEDASTALELLNQGPMESFEVTDAGEYKQPHCPECGSVNVSFGGIGKRLSYATVAVGVPLPVKRGGWKCDSCGHEWHADEDPEHDSVS